MISGGKVYVFTLGTRFEGSREKKIVAASKQLAWITIAGYVACHTLNPPITSIDLIGEHKIVDIAEEDNEASEKEAIDCIHNL